MSDRRKRKLRVILIAGIIFAVLFIAFGVLRVVRISAGIKQMKEEMALEAQQNEQQNTETPVNAPDPADTAKDPTTEDPDTSAYNEPDPEREKEPLEDIGENYFKEISSMDEVEFNEETGIRYVKNQLLVSCDLGMDKEFMEEACKAIDAEIVGYTEITSDFQIEFVEDKTYEELEEIAEQLKEYDFVRDVFFNTVSEVDVD